MISPVQMRKESPLLALSSLSQMRAPPEDQKFWETQTNLQPQFNWLENGQKRASPSCEFSAKNLQHDTF